MTTVGIPQIEKQQFKNESGGWIGVVLIGPKGDEVGAAVAPGDTVWLSEPEQVLTARAPRLDEHNPFIEQEWKTTDPTTGESVTVRYTPLVPVSEERWVPASGRPIPGIVNSSEITGAAAAAEAQVAASGDTPEYVTTAADPVAERHEEIAAAARDGQPIQPNVPVAPPRAAAAAAAASDPEPTAEETPVPEETAAATDPEVGEETGAATPPNGPAEVGSYQAQEEVGTPDAPQQAPAPWTPQNDPARVPPENA